MADTLHLRIVTPERLLLDEDVDEVTAPGAAGEFGILPNHTTFLSSLQPGRFSYKQGSQTHVMIVSGGFAEVVDNVMTVLTDTVEFPSDINVERARAALHKTEEELKTLSPADAAFAETHAAFQRAQARIDNASAGRN
ncbi:MAG: F0F1 ATP synthase subunit epsilon [Deltaproteobacteria bacterium]|nr:F0F1 ATP synthase subunit epsilon [Deltaproteobacteria bacterium]